jgi:hypothetical protein
MKKLIIAATLLISMSGAANASLNYTDTTRTQVPNTTTYIYTPNNVSSNESQIGDLDHSYYYTWGMNLGIDLTKVSITAASITFKNIQNWDTNSYTLWVHLLQHDVSSSSKVLGGVRSYYDGVNGDGNTNDEFASNGVLLKKYTSGIPYSNQSPATVTYDFIASDLASLNTYAAVATAGIIGLGFDPDCHFWNDGVSFSITTTPTRADAVPEPATMLLFGTGLAGLAGFRMRRKKN